MTAYTLDLDTALTQEDAAHEAAKTVAMDFRHDKFRVIRVEPNHQDDLAWDVMIEIEGELLRCTTWKECGETYCEW